MNSTDRDVVTIILIIIAGQYESVDVYLQSFGVVHQAGENDDAQHQEEYEQSQFLGGRLERVYEYLQPRRVSGQLEQPQDAKPRKKF